MPLGRFNMNLQVYSVFDSGERPLLERASATVYFIDAVLVPDGPDRLVTVHEIASAGTTVVSPKRSLAGRVLPTFSQGPYPSNVKIFSVPAGTRGSFAELQRAEFRARTLSAPSHVDSPAVRNPTSIQLSVTQVTDGPLDRDGRLPEEPSRRITVLQVAHLYATEVADV